MKELCFIVFGVVVCACSSSSSGGGAATGPEQACYDVADAVAKAAERCGQDYQANYNAFIANGAAGSCTNIKQVRDESSLRAVCVPSLSTVPCSDLLAGNLDASCKGQLLRPAGWRPTLAPASFFDAMGTDE